MSQMLVTGATATPEVFPTIANGTGVWFVRSASRPEMHLATVLSSSQFFDNTGHHYVIDCPSYPYVLGFADDNELFDSPEAAQACINELNLELAREQHKALLAELALVERKLETLAPPTQGGALANECKKHVLVLQAFFQTLDEAVYNDSACAPLIQAQSDLASAFEQLTGQPIF
ncbi:MAG: hypothetical protein Q7S87_08560 [Agitococcus sp.]|nr:hypothetical protein [Agitococcus sp.]MDO9177621.1 hypothetical protein [Agitococcus sp.]